MEIKKKQARSKELLYQAIAASLEEQIKNEVLKVGEKLPSIRTICRQFGVSMSTALQAYYLLESKSLIEARPQSGYYVRFSPTRYPALPAVSQPALNGRELPVEGLIHKVFHGLSNKQMTMFSLGVPALELLPVAKLNKSLVQAMRELPGSGLQYDSVQGNARLRRNIAKTSLQWGGRLTEKDLITTSGCSNALTYALMALTERGDTVVVESPVYFGVLQLARSLGLHVLELPTHPRTGIELEALQKVIARKKIKVVLLVSNFNNPLGSTMPTEHKQAVVRLLERYGIPLIEDDIYGDVFFGSVRPDTCKTYDESGMVLWCSSVSKTLAPGYRVGWIAPGKYIDKIMDLKLFQSTAMATLDQEVIANFLESGRYENHLRNFRQKIKIHAMQYMRAINEYFPEDTRVSHPDGGFFLWLEFNKKVDTLQLFERAIKQNISIAPGQIFTLQNQFNNCIRLCYALPWSDKLNQSLKTLGRLARSLSEK